MTIADALPKINDFGTKLVPKYHRFISGQLEPAPDFARGFYERFGVLNRVQVRAADSARFGRNQHLT